MRANRGIPRDLGREASQFKKAVSVMEEGRRHGPSVEGEKTCAEGRRKGRPVPQLLPSFQENCQMVEKVGIVSAKLSTAQCIFCVQNTKHKQKIKFKSFLHLVERSWISKSRIQPSPVLMNCNGQRGNQRQGGINRTPQCRLFGDFSKHKLDKIFAGGEGKKKYPARQGKGCAEHTKRSETTYICKFCVVRLHKGSCLERRH
ncbi:hypothetical protein Cfor_11355 [Coptotermes formosanus]|uniref:Uncharacterized protein n=1 Tax=Coptotermes formosanus TaxID=36987 RepID=A0A6L2PD04_COPFO|nr:hypothetical protein Cfor_11355 [Coptotermes formosanus]